MYSMNTSTVHHVSEYQHCSTMFMNTSNEYITFLNISTVLYTRCILIQSLYMRCAWKPALYTQCSYPKPWTQCLWILALYIYNIYEYQYVWGFLQSGVQSFWTLEACITSTSTVRAMFMNTSIVHTTLPSASTGDTLFINTVTVHAKRMNTALYTQCL